jgi:hypothetical protein
MLLTIVFFETDQFANWNGAVQTDFVLLVNGAALISIILLGNPILLFARFSNIRYVVPSAAIAAYKSDRGKISKLLLFIANRSSHKQDE